MKTSTHISRIATIVYANYTENVDMNNPLFNQSELNALLKKDKSIIRVDYFYNNKMIGHTAYTEKQALAQYTKMYESVAKLYDAMEPDGGFDWFKKLQRNEVRNAKIDDLHSKMNLYKYFISEEGYEQSDLSCTMCCDYEDFMG
jgi:hypothetical protein